MFIYLAALLMVITSLIHSFYGEKKLIVPLLALDSPLVKNRVVSYFCNWSVVHLRGIKVKPDPYSS